MKTHKHTIIILILTLILGLRQWQFEEHVSVLKEEQQLIQDSLHTYINEMGTALDLFTGGKPMVFTAYNATVGQCDDSPTITASNKSIFPGV